MPSARYLQYRSSLADGVPSSSRRGLASSSTTLINKDNAASTQDNGTPNKQNHDGNSGDLDTKTTITITTRTQAQPSSLRDNATPRSYQQYRASLAKSLPPAPQLQSVAAAAPTTTTTAPPPTATTTTPTLSASTQALAQSVDSSPNRYTAYRSTLAKQASLQGPATTPTNETSAKTSALTAQEQSVPTTTTATTSKLVPATVTPDDDDAKSAQEKTFNKTKSSATNPTSPIQDPNNKTQQDEDMDQLGTRLSSFFAKAEKGKPPPVVLLPPPTTSREMDLHASWSDFDPNDVPEDNASRVSTTASQRRGSNQRPAESTANLQARQKEIIQNALRSSQLLTRDEGRNTPKENNVNSTTTTTLRDNGESSFERNANLQQEETNNIQPIRTSIPLEKEESARDLENGIWVSKRGVVLENTTKKKWPTYCLISSLICAMVLLILAFVLGL